VQVQEAVLKKLPPEAGQQLLPRVNISTCIFNSSIIQHQLSRNRPQAFNY
jgi:hypothetical protein